MAASMATSLHATAATSAAPGASTASSSASSQRALSVSCRGFFAASADLLGLSLSSCSVRGGGFVAVQQGDGVRKQGVLRGRSLQVRAEAAASAPKSGPSTFKVAVLGASGGIGQPLSLLIKMSPLVSELRLYDIANVKGVAADLGHCNTPAQVSN